MFPRTSTRRTFLRRAGSTVLAATSLSILTAGCDADGDEPTTTAAPDPNDDEPGDDGLVASALDDATALASLYASALSRHPELRSELGRLRTQVDKHVRVLSGATDDSEADATPKRPVPRTPNAALRLLAAQEQRAVRHRRRDADRASSGDLARLLASMAACHAQHVRVLGPSMAPPASTVPEPGLVTVGVGPVIDAMNDVLAGEHAAIYAYGVIGGRLDYGSPPVREATEAWEIHRERRIGLTALIEAASETPVAAETGYRLPNDVRDVADAREVAQLVEGRCSVLYATLAATSVGDVRAYAVDALIDAAVRGYDWGASTSVLPGVSSS